MLLDIRLFHDPSTISFQEKAVYSHVIQADICVEQSIHHGEDVG